MDVVRRVSGHEIVDVVADLVGDAKRVAVAAECLVDVGAGSAVGRADAKRNLKGGRRLAAEDVDDFRRRERSWAARPRKLRALAQAQLPVPDGRDASHRGAHRRGRVAGCEEPVPLADQQISRIERHRNAMLDVQSPGAVPCVVIVLDVVVNQ